MQNDRRVSRTSDAGLIQSVDRAVRLLEAVAANPHPSAVNDLADSTGLNRSTAWRLLATLEHHGLVERDGISQRYAIGYHLVRLAAAKTDHTVLIRSARTTLERLASTFGETVNLSIATAASVVCIDQAEAELLVSVNWTNRSLPLYCTSNGKLALAALSPRDLEQYLADTPLVALAQHTIVDPGLLREEIARTAERGYGLTVDELEDGLHGISASIPGDGGPLGFVSISGPAFRLPEQSLHGISRALIAAGAEIAARYPATAPALAL
jgi:DNA-binding IclR family transcriptional regulator